MLYGRTRYARFSACRPPQAQGGSALPGFRHAPWPLRRPGGFAPRPGGFTLVELLVSIAIISILAAMTLFAMISAQDSARIAKTRGLIAKLDSLIRARWDSYRTRRVPIEFYRDNWTDANGNGRFDSSVDTYDPAVDDLDGDGVFEPGVSPAEMAAWRLEAIRELQRMELPERWNDILDDPVCPRRVDGVTPPSPANMMPRPAVSQAYLEKYNAIVADRKNRKLTPETPSVANQGAECLYLIITTGLSDELDARQLFGEGNVGDKDGDGALEFWDAWGNPIEFLRWAPGFVSDFQPIRVDESVRASTGDFKIDWPAWEAAPPPADPLDPANVYGWNVGRREWGEKTLLVSGRQIPFNANRIQLTFSLYPLIFSGGPDGEDGIAKVNDGGTGDPDPLHYGRPRKAADKSQYNNPFFMLQSPKELEAPPYAYYPPPPFGGTRPYGWPAGGHEKDTLDNIHNHLIRAK